MFKCDEFIYIQMQKTACSHIATLLAQLFNGKTIGKHNSASAKQLQTTTYFIASMRNPWDWYLSLWTFGVSKRGRLWQHLTHKYWLDLARAIEQDPKNITQYCVDFFKKDTKKWQRVYQNNADVKAFRLWLTQLHQPNSNLGEGYDESGASHQIGFMTYRYLYLCCQFNRWSNEPNLSLGKFNTLKQIDQEYCYIDYFIRQENLEATLIEAIERVRALSTKEKLFIQNSQKTNTSPRAFPLTDYYDRHCVELIANRDRLLIEKFNYQPPKLYGEN